MGVHLSEWNTEGKLGQYSTAQAEAALIQITSPSTFSWCVPLKTFLTNTAVPLQLAHRLPSPSPRWLACSANIYPFRSIDVMCKCCTGASWSLVRGALSLALVSTGRDTQRPPPDSIFPLNAELPNPNWQPFMPRIPGQKAEKGGGTI